jgi:heme oxygenase
MIGDVVRLPEPREVAGETGRRRSLVMGLLKERTSSVHERVEAQLGLLDPNLSAARLKAVLARFFGFWDSNESQIAVWSADSPAISAGLQCADRRRAGLFAADLTALGLTSGELELVPRAPLVFDRLTDARVLGWLYVTEGSTLGGALITRHLRSVNSLRQLRLGSFRPYGEGPGAMWRAFTSALDGFVAGDLIRAEAVVASGLSTFEALEGWLAPLALSGAV